MRCKMSLLVSVVFFLQISANHLYQANLDNHLYPPEHFHQYWADQGYVPLGGDSHYLQYWADRALGYVPVGDPSYYPAYPVEAYPTYPGGYPTDYSYPQDDHIYAYYPSDPNYHPPTGYEAGWRQGIYEEMQTVSSMVQNPFITDITVQGKNYNGIGNFYQGLVED
eukprot:GFUD01024464.1.p1 GENE.GFUD01024464.1~~GFUD01024464.1.p1  ORF type:complete len:166 (-),score=14.99 GFUD01024464.1:135-632(-)